MKKLILTLLPLIVITNFAFSAIDTISIYSNSMFKTVKCVVVTPVNYQRTSSRFPVVYLLHGYSGNYSNWVSKVPEIQSLADEHNCLIVCPDGAFSSWYFDSPVDLTMRYETNVGLEIPAYIDSNYNTIRNRKGRAITGLSMGGHGGLFLGFRHADIFGACGSMSGVLNVSQIPQNFDIYKRLGDTAINKQYYLDFSVINVVDKRPSDSLAIIIDCGTEDFLIEMNRKQHEKMVQLKIPHDYIERPGKHDWDYWRNAVQYQMLFFDHYFNSK